MALCRWLPVKTKKFFALDERALQAALPFFTHAILLDRNSLGSMSSWKKLTRSIDFTLLPLQLPFLGPDDHKLISVPISRSTLRPRDFHFPITFQPLFRNHMSLSLSLSLSLSYFPPKCQSRSQSSPSKIYNLTPIRVMGRKSSSIHFTNAKR